VTWRLYGSLPVAHVGARLVSTSERFVAFDKVLDATRTGPQWLRQPDIGRLVVDIFRKGEDLGHYELGSWVLMPNHVHLLIKPEGDLSRVIASIKSASAVHANRALRRTGEPFWAKDYFDRWIRDSAQESRTIRYVENNPVRAGLCRTIEEWPWSSANCFGLRAG
jgi:REP element-mobilizing transposase RayT